MRKLGYLCETTEHKQGRFRKDMFNCFDGLAVREGEAIFFQAYHKKEEKNHAWLDANHEVVLLMKSAGFKVEHHPWSFKTRKGRKYWQLERRLIV